MNKVFLIGNLTHDIVLSKTAAGTSVCKIPIAINRNYTNADGEREVDFIDVIVWRELAENCVRYLSKGKKIAVMGVIQTRNYKTDKERTRYVTEILASEIEFLSPKTQSETDSKTEKKEHKRVQDLKAINDEDLPF